MQLRKGDHASDEALEQYATHSLPEAALAEIEEHLLVCSQCQQQLEEIDAYVSAMRDAAKALGQQDESRKRFWTRVSHTLTFRKLGWAMAVAALVLGAVALRISTKRPVAPFALVLETSRGSGMQHAPAGRRLELSLNTQGLPSFSGYELEIVDDSRAAAIPVTHVCAAVRSEGDFAGWPPSGDLLRPALFTCAGTASRVRAADRLEYTPLQSFDRKFGRVGHGHHGHDAGLDGIGDHEVGRFGDAACHIQTDDQ